jgi:hypothetical protein
MLERVQISSGPLGDTKVKTKKGFDWLCIFLPPGLTIFCALVFFLKIINRKLELNTDIVVLMGTMIGMWTLMLSVGLLLYFGFCPASLWIIMAYSVLWVIGNLWY